MFRKTKTNYYIFDRFKRYSGIVHGFSTRDFGDLSIKKSLGENNKLDGFLRVLGLGKGNLVMMEQIHGKRVMIVGEKDRGKVIKRTDGLITQHSGVALGVKVADCLPLLFWGPKERIIGVAHAGWKGVLLGITKVVIEKMKTLKSQPENILVGIGPHIGSCCYSIDEERKKRFIRKFGNLRGMILKKGGRTFLNLTIPMKLQLIKLGVREKNIELSTVCTSCQTDEFFSFRKDNQETYGEILGIICLKN